MELVLHGNGCDRWMSASAFGPLRTFVFPAQVADPAEVVIPPNVVIPFDLVIPAQAGMTSVCQTTAPCRMATAAAMRTSAGVMNDHDGQNSCIQLARSPHASRTHKRGSSLK